MNEDDWYRYTDPQVLFAFVGPRMSERKTSLFFAACCRTACPHDEKGLCHRVIEWVERYAEGLTASETIARMHAIHARRPGSSLGRLLSLLTCARETLRGLRCAETSGNLVVSEAQRVASRGRRTDWAQIRVAQAGILRDLLGPWPFRTVRIEDSWRARDDRTVEKVARSIYERRAFHDMPILHDALMDGGCDNEEILRHCRDVKDHWKGCWVVDLCLGKDVL
jgi:hypothetical protein